MAYEADTIPASACPTCVGALETGGAPGVLAASHDLPGLGTCKLVAGPMKGAAPYIDLGPCDLCGVPCVVRHPLTISILTDTPPASLDKATAVELDPDVVWKGRP